MRQQPWGRDVLLIAVTGWGRANDKEKSRAAGFDHHLSKPVDPAYVEDLLRAFLLERHTQMSANPDARAG